MSKLLLVISLIILFASCDPQSKDIILHDHIIIYPSKEKFIDAHWQSQYLWIVTRDTITGVVYIRNTGAYSNIAEDYIIRPKIDGVYAGGVYIQSPDDNY